MNVDRRCSKCGCERGYTKAVEIVSSRCGIDLRTGKVDEEAAYYEGVLKNGTGRVIYCERCDARICTIDEIGEGQWASN